MRFIDEDLLDCLRRPDPYVEYAVEVSAPDVGQVLRRAADQFFSEPPGVAGTQTGSIAPAVTGGMQLTGTPGAIGTFAAGGGPAFPIRVENAQRAMLGMAWAVDPSFVRATARNFTADVSESNLVPSPIYASVTPKIDWQLQVYRVTRTPGQLVAANGSASPFTQYAFTALLNPAPIIKGTAVTWSGATGSRTATLNWDLSAFGLIVESTPSAGLDPTAVTELPIYLFVIQPLNGPDNTTDWYRWRTTASGIAQTVAGVGKFTREYWTRGSDDAQWAQADFTDTPACSLSVDSYGASASKVYAIDLGRAPTVGTTGRIVFERQLPRGTAATLALSTAGASGPFTAVQAGDVVTTPQQQYWLQVTLTSDSAHRSTPIVNGFGVEFRVPYDVGELSITSTPTRDIAPPTLEASIAEATLRVLRIGERDFLDPATVLGSTAPTSKLEVDVYLRSRHPLILTDRSKWLHLERLAVSDREPSSTSEAYSLLSYAQNLAVKLPAQVETINTVHTVQSGTTATAVKVTPVLPGTSVGGHEYNGLSYYIRIRSSSVAGVGAGSIFVVQGSTGIDELDFPANTFPSALQPGDVFELHSGITTTARLKWVNEDPAVIWDELLALCPNVSAERIGCGFLPRSGRPPTVADRFPGDPTSQAKATLSLEVKDATEASKLLDQVSFWMGGATIELAGQICYVQIYPLTAVDGTVTVPVAPVAAIFDPRDLVVGSLTTKPNVASRKAVVTAKYGTNNAAADPGQYPTRITRAVDGDAVDFLSKGDLSFVGSEDLSDDLCRWLYNSADLGLMMASLGTRQVCLSCSTGIRVFPFQTVESWPEVTMGDTVVVITDQYTDYDPARKLALSGWLALRGVVVHVGPDARDFAIFVLGLMDGVQRIAGGVEGSLAGIGEPPGAPGLTGGYDAGGHPVVTLTPGARTASVRIVAQATTAPSEAMVLAAAAIDGPFNPMSFPGVTVAAGSDGYIGIIAYTGTGGTGVAGELTLFRLPRAATGGSGGTVPRPAALFDVVIYDATQVELAMSGALGVGDPGPLEYRWRTDSAVWPAYTTSHPNQTIPRAPKATQVFQFQVRQSDGQESTIISFPVTGAQPGLDETTGQVDPTQPLSGTSHFIPRATDINGWILDPNTQATGAARPLTDESALQLSPAYSAQNLLENSGFEIAAAAGATVPAGWSNVSGGAWQVIREVSNGTFNHSGSSALMLGALTSPSTVFSGQGAAISDRKLAVAPGQQFALRFWCRSDQNIAFPAGQGAFCIGMLRVFYDNGTFTDLSVNGPIGVNPTFALYQGILTIPATPAGRYILYACVILQAVSTGTPAVTGIGEVYDTRWDEVELVRVVDDAELTGTRVYGAMDGGSNLLGTVQQYDNPAATTLNKKPIKGYQSGVCYNGQAITFPVAFQNPPAMRFLRGQNTVTYQPDSSKWSTPGSFLSTKAQIEDVRPAALSATGFTCVAQLVQTGSGSNQNSEFPTSNALTAAGQATQLALANVPSSNGHYTVRYKVEIDVASVFPRVRTATVVVVVNRRAGGPTGAITELRRDTYSCTDTSGSGSSYVSGVLSYDINGTLAAGDYLEIAVDSVTSSGTGTSVVTVHGCNTSDDGAGHDGESHTYGGTTITSSMTQDTAHDSVIWEAWSWQ